MKEVDMFEPTKELLIRKGFKTIVAEVWEADVVGLNDTEEIIVEMKKTLNFKLLEQAFRHFGHAKYIYIAIPKGKGRFNPNHRFAYDILREYGIGIIFVPQEGDGRAYIEFESAEHHITRNIREGIQEHHYLAKGGSKSGETVTAYSLTIDRVKAFMKKCEDWVSVDDVLKDVETHWARPRESLSADLRMKHNADWCEWKRHGRGTVFRFKANDCEQPKEVQGELNQA